MRILVVDDSKVARMMAKRSYTNLGYEVVGEAADGILAIEQYERLKPDLVSTDLEMPNLNGLGLVQQLRAMGSDVKVIVISSVVSTVLIKRLEGMSASIVKKPFTEATLKAAIEQLQ